MTYRLLLWFDMLEEEGKSTERIRRLFANRTPPLTKDLSKRRRNGSGFGFEDGSGLGFGLGNTINGDGFGNGKLGYGNGTTTGNGFGTGYIKIMAVKYDIQVVVMV